MINIVFAFQMAIFVLLLLGECLSAFGSPTLQDPTHSMTLDSKTASSAWRAFSLIEVLVVVAVIGVMAAIALPALQSLSDQSQDAQDQRNAQNIAQVSSALKNLGVDHVKLDGEGGVLATAELLTEGVVVPHGPFQGELFAVRAMDEDAITGAVRFLEIMDRSGDLWVVYTGPDK